MISSKLENTPLITPALLKSDPLKAFAVTPAWAAQIIFLPAHDEDTTPDGPSLS